MVRIEKDLLGSKEIPDSVYWGISTFRAIDNFGKLTSEKVHFELIQAIAMVKRACALANVELGFLERKKGEAIIQSCKEIEDGSLYEQFCINPLSGGAGTPFNMNINEVIANRSLEILGYSKGDYKKIHPLDDVNLHQSTNDVFPTSVKIAVLILLDKLKNEVRKLQGAFQEKEFLFSDILKVGRTEMQDALPVTVGQEFGAWAEALNRDWWRLNKAFERIRQVNIGGTAVGTGLNCPANFSEIVLEKLREISKLPLAKAENLFESTQNMDGLAEVAGFLKTLAVNLIKISSDLRLLSSGPKAGIGELRLPAVQVGSSIMPGKVNPVIPEMVTQVGIKIFGMDFIVSMACSLGNLELNSFLPLIAHELIGGIKLLKRCCNIFREKCVKGIEVDKDRCKKWLKESSILVTAFLPYLGYDICTEVYKQSIFTKKTIENILVDNGYFSEEDIDNILSAKEVTTPGFAGINYLDEKSKEE